MDVVNWVVEHWIATNRGSTVREAAKATKIPERKCRTALEDARARGLLLLYMDARVSYSKAYPMMESGAHQVAVYEPEARHLADMLLAERAGHDEGPSGEHKRSAELRLARVLAERYGFMLVEE